MTTQELVTLIEGRQTVTVMAHGFDRGELFDLMQDGQLESLKRESRGTWTSDGPELFYLVGTTKLDGIDVTLFSEDFTVPAGVAA